MENNGYQKFIEAYNSGNWSEVMRLSGDVKKPSLRDIYIVKTAFEMLQTERNNLGGIIQ